MLSNRIKLGLAVMLLVFSAGLSARAQNQDPELMGGALFEPADVRPYDNWAAPKEGFFFTFDGLYWHISPPNKTQIGSSNSPQVVFVGGVAADNYNEYNSLDTSTPSVWKWGDRMELGYVEGHHGFLFTSLLTESQTSEIHSAHADVVFDDPAQGQNGYHLLDTLVIGGPDTLTIPPVIVNGVVVIPGFTTNLRGRTPVNFDSIYVQNKSRVGGVEALYLYRPTQLPCGGTLEFTAGGRYLELKDQFWVDARGGNLTDSYWNTESHNEIAGPEIGLRFIQPCGRFAVSAEGRFTAGLNSQSVDQDGILASGLVPGGNNVPPQPILMSATSFTHSTHWIEFSPIIELRVEAHMQLTNLIAVKAGYTGIFINNVVRAADMINYQVPSMGITRDLNGNLQSVYMQGLNLSIELNR